MGTPIGERLKARRKAKGMTQKELAKAVGVVQSAISEIERGGSQSASAENLLRIAAILDTNPHWLLTGKGDPELSSFKVDDSQVQNLSNNLPADKKAAWIAAGLALLNSPTD
jgi:transcriptional regulator with XRE-family HTH domain